MSLYHMHCVSTAVEASFRGSRRCTAIQETCAEDDTWLAALKYLQSRGRLLVELKHRYGAHRRVLLFRKLQLQQNRGLLPVEVMQRRQAREKLEELSSEDRAAGCY